MDKMKKCHILIFCTIAVLSTGCLDFGDDINTTSPTKKQIDDCISRMYLNPSLKIEPVGYMYQGSGMDDAICLKFYTDTNDIDTIFAKIFVDKSKFAEGFTFSQDPADLNWWDTANKTFYGAQIELPNNKFMNVGIEKVDDKYAVYIFWHEV